MKKMQFLKKIDSIFGKIAIDIAAVLAQAHSTLESTESFLLIRPGGIGDAVLLAPVIHALKERCPKAIIDVLAEKRNAALFSLCPAVSRVLLYENPDGLLGAIRGRYNVVIDTEQWHRISAVVARLTRAPIVIGYATNERKKLFTHPISYSHNDYEVDSFFRLIEPLGIEKPSGISIPFLKVPVEAAERAGALLGSCYGRHFVAIFPGASSTERRWGAEKFREVVKRLHSMAIPVVVVGGKEDAATGDKIISGFNGLNFAGKTTLAETAAVIEKAAVLVSGDTGILHTGVGLGKPTVSLFGPGIAKKWAPRGELHIVINKCLPCSPCTKFGYTPKCPINAKCMSDITVDEVMQGIERLMRKP